MQSLLQKLKLDKRFKSAESEVEISEIGQYIDEVDDLISAQVVLDKWRLESGNALLKVLDQEDI